MIKVKIEKYKKPILINVNAVSLIKEEFLELKIQKILSGLQDSVNTNILNINLIEFYEKLDKKLIIKDINLHIFPKWVIYLKKFIQELKTLLPKNSEKSNNTISSDIKFEIEIKQIQSDIYLKEEEKCKLILDNLFVNFNQTLKLRSDTIEIKTLEQESPFQDSKIIFLTNGGEMEITKDLNVQGKTQYVKMRLSSLYYSNFKEIKQEFKKLMNNSSNSNSGFKLNMKLEFEIEEVEVYLSDENKIFGFEMNGSKALYDLSDNSYNLSFKRVFTYLKIFQNQEIIQYPYIQSQKFLFSKKGNERKIFSNHLTFCWNTFTKLRIEELKYNLFPKSSSTSEPIKTEFEIQNFIYQLKYTNQSILEFHILKMTQNPKESYFKNMKLFITHEKIFECDEIKYKKFEKFKSIFDEYQEEASNDKKFLKYLEFFKIRITIPNKTNFGTSMNQFFLSRRILVKLLNEVSKQEDWSYENLIVSFKDFKLELQDDPIEKSLSIHQQLWLKEVKERKEREDLLLLKINKKQDQMHLLLEELEKQNSKIYFEKLLFFKKNNPIPNELFTLEFSELELNFRSRNNGIQFLNQFFNFKDFLSTFYKNISWNIKDILVQIRNFPIPLIKVDSSIGQGDFLYGKMIPTENDTIERLIYFENEEHKVPYYLNPSMLFYNFKGSITNFNSFVGKSYGPTFGDISILLDRILPRNLDPSPKKLWWDKIRHRLHGKFEMEVYSLKSKFLLGLNNYDPTENLEVLIKSLSVNLIQESLKIKLDDLKLKYHPSLSLFPNLADIPFLEIQIDFKWKCKGDEKNPFFKVVLPHEFKTEKGIEKYKNDIPFDSYQDWKLILFHLNIDLIFYPKLNDKSTNSNFVLMLDPISLSFLLKFIFFYNHEHWQLHIGKVYKFGLKRIDYNISHFIKSINIHLKGFNPILIWSNGVEDNRILNLGLSNFELSFIGERDEMPNLKIPKNQRPRTSYSIHLLKILIQNLEAQVYEDLEKFGKNFLFSISKFEFLKGNEKIENKNEYINEYESKLIVQDLKGLYSASNRDSILIWIDLIDQFLDRDFDKQSFLKRLQDSNQTTKNTISKKKFILLMLNTQIYLAGEKNEIFLLKSSNGNIEVCTNESKSIEVLSLMDNIEIFSLKKEDFDTNSKMRILMEPSPWIFRFNNEKTKSLHIEIPDLDVNFTSRDLKIFQDIISNVIIPKKMVRKVFSEELIQSEIYKTSLDITDIQEKCELIRKEIRQLESELNQSSRNLNNLKKIEKDLIEKKILYRGLKENIQKKMNESRKEKNQNEIDMITSLTVHNCKWKMLDKNDKIFMEALFILFQGNVTKHRDYSLIFDFTLHYFTIKNKLPNPVYEDLLIPFQDNVIDNDDYMLRVYIKKSNSVGGIRIVDHFEIELAPIHLQLTYQSYSQLWAYFFPLVEKQKQDESKLIDSVTTLNSKLEKIVTNDSLDINIMKERAKNTMIFNYIHIHKMKFYLSFKGVSNGITQIIRNFDKTKLRLNPIIIHQQSYTWFQLFEALKKNIIKQVLSYIPSTIKSVIENKLKYTTTKKQEKKEDKILNHKKLVNEIQKLKQSKNKNMDDLKRSLLFGKKEVKKDKKLIEDSSDEEISQIDTQLIFDQIQNENKNKD